MCRGFMPKATQGGQNPSSGAARNPGSSLPPAFNANLAKAQSVTQTSKTGWRA